MTDAYLYAAVRTPFGRFGGALAEVLPDDLAARALRLQPGRGDDRITDGRDGLETGWCSGANAPTSLPAATAPTTVRADTPQSTSMSIVKSTDRP
jgi:hypothetical protein